jgi:hypothetical protein
LRQDLAALAGTMRDREYALLGSRHRVRVTRPEQAELITQRLLAIGKKDNIEIDVMSATAFDFDQDHFDDVASRGLVRVRVVAIRPDTTCSRSSAGTKAGILPISDESS